MKTKDFASRRFWRRMSPRSTFYFLAAVFFIFAPVGFIMDILNGGQLSIERVWLGITYSGLVSTGYAFSFTRSYRILAPTFIFQFGFHFIPWAQYFPGGPETALEIQNRMVFDGLGILACIILAYIILIRFITTEGIKQIALSTEMELAGEIHRVLVPDIDVSSGQFEITGRSVPTDEVGGDLIDIIDNENEMIVYMIDVSGHGVGPGLLTGMFKASFRSLYEKNKSLNSITNNLNTVLLDQKKKGMFITFCGLRFYDENAVEVLLAGHPPIIRIDKSGNSEEVKFTSQLPLLSLRDTEYQSNILNSESGDLFVIYSDGIIETTNKKGAEFGFERFEKILRDSYSLSTSDISDRVYKELKAHGTSHDDQSLIIIRKK